MEFALFQSLALEYVFSFPVVSAISVIPTPADIPELAEAFRTGKFEWNDLLIFGLWLIKQAIAVAGVFLVITVIRAGYTYILGSLVDDKEKGKDTLKNAAIGFALVVLSWAIVDIVIAFITE